MQESKILRGYRKVPKDNAEKATVHVQHRVNPVRPFVHMYLIYILLFTVCNYVEPKGVASGRVYSVSHGWHGDRGALQCGVFCLPLGGDSFNLGVELDALQKNGKQTLAEDRRYAPWLSFHELGLVFRRSSCPLGRSLLIR